VRSRAIDSSKSELPVLDREVISRLACLGAAVSADNPMRILLAEDDPTSRLVVETALRSLGHECHAVIDGTQAWEAFRSQQPDVVISDSMMPGLSGLELCRKIRAHRSPHYTYFIMVTSRGALHDVLEGMNAGADDYLIKPLDPDDLEARLVAAARVTTLHAQLASQRIELEGLNHELTVIAGRDPLTGLGNRRALEDDLFHLEAQVSRYGHRYCMALFDVDHFKSFNDTYGHPAGDEILKLVATQLYDHARAGDTMYRYGGEEFLCIFPEQSLATGTLAVERMRTGVERLAVPHAGTPLGVLTISAGMAMLDPGDTRSSSEVLREADQALYRAKLLGRNRVEQPTARQA
jgi:diguanylate cyclase (GGDEF)-like protein